MSDIDLDQLEYDLLLEAIRQRYGYDFREYAPASLKRRFRQACELSGVEHLSEFIPRLLHSQDAFEQFLSNIFVSVTEMFRDPPFFAAFREKVIPVLKTYPFIKIWLAGCSTGEEAYAIAIMLIEEGFYDRAQIYATDYNSAALKKGVEGIYDESLLARYAQNYLESGGEKSLSEYYHTRYNAAKMHERLKTNILFSHHNLVSDGIFGEMNVVICRNVMIYFNQNLQNHVLRLFHDSLCHRGYLCLGNKETLKTTAAETLFEEVCYTGRIYRKK